MSWRSKLQTLTAASTFESELIALSFAANEAAWIRKLLSELNFAMPDNVNLRSLPNDPKGFHKEIEPTSVIDYDRHDDSDSAQPKDDTPALAPTPVLVDNKSVEFAVNNPETSQRTRHLETRYFKVRDYVRQHAIRVRHIRTDVNLADFFTKALEKTKFTQYRSYLGMENFDPSGG